jgi:hypothetical protein
VGRLGEISAQRTGVVSLPLSFLSAISPKLAASSSHSQHVLEPGIWNLESGICNGMELKKRLNSCSIFEPMCARRSSPQRVISFRNGKLDLRAESDFLGSRVNKLL